MLVFVLNQAQKANTGKIQTPVYENVREFGIEGLSRSMDRGVAFFRLNGGSVFSVSVQYEKLGAVFY